MCILQVACYFKIIFKSKFTKCNYPVYNQRNRLIRKFRTSQSPTRQTSLWFPHWSTCRNDSHSTSARFLCLPNTPNTAWNFLLYHTAKMYTT